VDEVTLIGSRCGSFTTALELLAAEKINPRPLIEQTFQLHDGVEAINYAGNPGVLKVLIRP
jgi:threonine dehydrogenase-like Zn-dependent dehydrogenase